ncbi:hypothetical protein RYY30_000192 [Vibrio cholerae]|uniref:hypothetical protein n=1 Tax=Vibrio vulnificus TaxID=672 RepID=UPI001A1CDE7A|nr:hypothetical protein [Vibrio cholerae]EGQ7954444.1 hypothetical protein [Vibrio vulnificus]EGQ7985316.1 hypothetical protein [Vibrio vulnificus]EGQ9237239.1 hypothetical protein [Vibrio vulnificus]EGR0158854.1 hypothetical protein [Vibrio cholerae]
MQEFELLDRLVQTFEEEVQYKQDLITAIRAEDKTLEDRLICLYLAINNIKKTVEFANTLGLELVEGKKLTPQAFSALMHSDNENLTPILKHHAQMKSSSNQGKVAWTMMASGR